MLSQVALLESFDARSIHRLLASLLLFPPTLSKTTLMEMINKGGSNGVYWVCSKCPDTSSYKGKNQKNAQENEEARRKRENPKQHRHTWSCVVGARPCASHHRPWRASRSARGGSCLARSRCFFNAVFCALLMLEFGPQVLPMLGHLGTPLQASFIIQASQGSFFLKLLGSPHVNMQLKLEKAETSVIGEIGA